MLSSFVFHLKYMEHIAIIELIFFQKNIQIDNILFSDKRQNLQGFPLRFPEFQLK